MAKDSKKLSIFELRIMPNTLSVSDKMELANHYTKNYISTLNIRLFEIS